MYNRQNFQSTLVKEQLFLRDGLIKKFKHLKRELDRILDKSGKIVRIQVVADYNQKVKDFEQANRYENISDAEKERLTKEMFKGHVGKLKRGTALSVLEGPNDN